VSPPEAAALEATLPDELRGPETTISKVASGLSGAGVYRVEAAGKSYVLKVAAANAPLDGWRRLALLKESLSP
jgi:hypothetical protein